MYHWKQMPNGWIQCSGTGFVFNPDLPNMSNDMLNKLKLTFTTNT